MEPVMAGPEFRRVLAALIICGVFYGSSQPAHAIGVKYSLFGGKQVQLFGFGIYRTKQNPDQKTCAVYVGSDDEAQAGRQSLVDLADRVFEEYLGPDCADSGATKASIFVGNVVLVVFGVNSIGTGNIESGSNHIAKALDDPTSPGETRVDYSAAKPRFFQRVSQPDIPVAASLREPNFTPRPTEIEPGVMVGVENIFELNPDNSSKPYAVVLYQTDVSIQDEVASKALGQKVLRKMLGARLNSGALRGASAGAANEPKLGRFQFRDFYRYDEAAPH